MKLKRETRTEEESRLEYEAFNRIPWFDLAMCLFFVAFNAAVWVAVFL